MREKSRSSAPSSRSERGHPDERHPGQTDWVRVDATTDEEIATQIASDPDTPPEVDEAWIAAARRHMPRRQKVVAMRIDEEVIEWFKAQGGPYQPRMNAVLRGYMETRGTAGDR
jgi:uncharacterized protein (DUF4415 family)